MNDIENILLDIAIQGVTLWAENGKLRYRGPKAVMNPVRLAQLQAHKPALLEFLADEGRYLPLAHGQQALWFIQQSDPMNTAYNIPVPLRIRAEALDVARLKQSLQALVDRHPMLRTVFITHQGRPLQKIFNRSQLAWEEIDTAWTYDESMVQIYAHAQHPFDLAAGPLLRTTLFHCNGTLVLLLCAHHIICDDWSTQVMLDDLRKLYAKPLGLGMLQPLDKQYADYVHWESELLSREGSNLAAYWQKQLAAAPVLNLPTDRPRPPVLNLRGATHGFHLSQDLSLRLKTLARTEGVTPYTLLLAAFAVLLHRYTGQDDIVIGSPTSISRSQGEFTRTVGYFVNPIAIRLDLSGNPSFKSFLRKAYQTVLEGLSHHAYPFPLLVHDVQPKRDPSRSPLFQTLFVFQNLILETDAAESQATDTAFEILETRQMEGQFDLVLTLEEDAATADAPLACAFKYHTDLFTAPSIVRLADHWQTLLEGIVAATDTAIGMLPLLAPTERKQLLVEWNASARAIPPDICFHNLVEAQVERTPDATAVVFVGSNSQQNLTYRELNARANQLAYRLHSQGGEGSLGAESIIGVYADRSLEVVVALLGILKAGCAYLPLDPNYPQDRLAFMVEDARVTTIVTQPQLIESLPKTAQEFQLICLDSTWQDIEHYPSQNPTWPVAADNLAYVIYTSGSTGKPKGVLVEHLGFGNLALAQSQKFDVDSTSRVLQVASLNFDASLSEMAMALCCGATLCVADKAQLQPGPSLVRLLQQQAITHATLTPSALAVMPLVSLPDLRTLIVAGEACSADLAKRWVAGRRFFNAYGPTEATVCATIMECTDSSLVNGQAPPIGRPMDNVQIYIFDPQYQPVPIGVPGELHVGGMGVARGYLNRIALTDERFIGCTLDSVCGDSRVATRLYKTGDLARYLPDGNIEFLGRIDQQVKVRGHRIELGEIEACLMAQPGIQNVAIVVQGEGSAKRLVAYWSASPTQPATTEELRRALVNALPDYMIPSLWLALDALPFTPNGKVDRQALSTLPLAGGDVFENDFIPPRDEIEQSLSALWAEVLQLPRIGVRADFFESGGHSLLAVCLLNRIEQQFGQILPLAAFLQAATVEQLAILLRQRARGTTVDRSPLVAIQPGRAQTARNVLFCIHPVGGNVLCYRGLARCLGPEQTLYGLQAKGLQQGEEPLADIAEMARYYREAIETLQPCGPYALVGWSMGGLIAYEMALQWIEVGKEIALLALIESHAFLDGQVRADLMREAEDKERLLAHFLEDLKKVMGQGLNPDESSQHLLPQEQLERIWKELTIGTPSPASPDLQYIHQWWRVFQANVKAIAHYIPKPCSQPLVLFHGDTDPADSDLGWSPLAAAGLHKHSLGGDHYSILQSPLVGDVATLLNTYLLKT
ncbi:MAG: non-ribosomal peptide synthetase [Candidatus Methylumidiphilus alinenensis]|uniref:Non-ribosomal peptide synthetase n=1 Tax=Candidatus Methylumidiphilus alinenensis TaxID=2202197 RepID=A0A2W4TG94_9GAMM|nr:MAG: non-ribosomal peptide synthetase [Candidatus Methylumidiphilus alinenensis]